MRSLVSPRGSKPIWNFVEVGHPFTENDAPTIQAAAIRAAVWHSLIAGARGILYFNHNFGGPCQSQHVLRDSCGAAVRPTVKAVNEQIKRLAPVLNAPFADGSLDHRRLRSDRQIPRRPVYIFAANKNAARTATFDAPASATPPPPYRRSRTLPITDGPSTTPSPTATPSTSTASTAAPPAASASRRGACRG